MGGISFTPDPPIHTPYFMLQAPQLNSSAMYTLAPNRCLSRGPHRPSTCLARSASTSPPPQVRVRPAEDDDVSLRSTWPQRAWVAAGSATVISALAASASAADTAGDVAAALLAAALGYGVADLGSGFYHWAIDNYGGAHTPVFGPQIAAFQGHHRRPGTITIRGTANNLAALARAVALAVAPAEAALEIFGGGGSATVHAFVGAAAGCVMLSQQFHAWAHVPRRRLPPAVLALQDAGLLISTRQHAAHHRPPYNGNYCIVSGAWNGLLEELRVFEAMEMMIFFKFGIRPRSWSEPGSEWTEETVNET